MVCPPGAYSSRAAENAAAQVRHRLTLRALGANVLIVLRASPPELGPSGGIARDRRRSPACAVIRRRSPAGTGRGPPAGRRRRLIRLLGGSKGGEGGGV